MSLMAYAEAELETAQQHLEVVHLTRLWCSVSVVTLKMRCGSAKSRCVRSHTAGLVRPS
jgi:hypothetical protein